MSLKDTVGVSTVKTTLEEKQEAKELNMYDEYVDLIRTLLDLEFPIMLVGEAGMGKSYTARLSVLDRPFTTMNLSKQHDLIDLLGQYVLVTEKTADGSEVSVTKWKDGKVTQAAKEGKVLILEELTMAEPTVLAALHGLFEVPAKLHTLEGDVDVHPDFRVICTANPSWTNYQGVSDLNYAFEDRFVHIVFDFPTREQMNTYLEPFKDSLTDNEISIEDMYKMTSKLFEMYPEDNNYYISLRGIRAFCMLLDHYPVKQSLDLAFLNKIPPTERDEVMDIIDNFIPLTQKETTSGGNIFDDDDW